ncbi:clan AA aspartic protease [Chamaesiphon sp. VAR_48_metabat_403]|uniref:clan AA aspartic protease n=1 Tax=Chamaesiphon sp. VAR_48_metabat_403 TaxID=2964700 RepID=UPI00286E6B66|nr:clan AA aspartic protease [Chamaesiphon sp. VAR_48_metabat_403]
MIQGRVVNGRPNIQVIFLLPGQPGFGIDFVVDTGFNDYLTLPQQAVRLMNLPLYSSVSARLADNSESLLPIYLATIQWDGEEKVVPVLATGMKPLLGTSLLKGFRLEIDFEANGLVSIFKL